MPYLDGAITIYIGHNYIGHNYIGHSYMGHTWMAPLAALAAALTSPTLFSVDLAPMAFISSAADIDGVRLGIAVPIGAGTSPVQSYLSLRAHV